MRNLKDILYNIAKHSSNENYKFERVYRLLYNENLIIKAIGNIYSNNGSGTAGIDGFTLDGFRRFDIQYLIKQLKNETYKPYPLKRQMIPKANGKERPLGIPSFRDRVIQEAVRMLLEAMYEGSFHERSHGFRPNRSCHTALLDIKEQWGGICWFVEGDIKGCFDNINHNILINILRDRIKDEKFIRLIWKFLKSGFIFKWKYEATMSGTPQGGIMSPILSNIYMDRFDKAVDQYIDTFKKEPNKKEKFSNDYVKLQGNLQHLRRKLKSSIGEEKVTWRRGKYINRRELISMFKEKRKKLLNSPTDSVNKGGYLDFRYVRYADDFIIGVNGSKQDAIKVKEYLTRWLKESLNLDLSPEKTLITNASKACKFLGYWVEKNMSNDAKRSADGRVTRKNRNKIRLMVPSNYARNYGVANNYIKDANAKEWRYKQASHLQWMSDIEIMGYFKSIRDGLYEYYKLATNVGKVMHQIDYMLYYVMAGTLGHKHKCNRSNIFKKHVYKGDFRMTYETKSGTKSMKWRRDEGLGRDKNTKDHIKNSIDIKPEFNGDIIGKYQGHNEFERRLMADECEVCGSREDIHIHHINRIRDLKDKKDKYSKMMAQRNRKTLFLCRKCHHDAHNNNWQK